MFNWPQFAPKVGVGRGRVGTLSFKERRSSKPSRCLHRIRTGLAHVGQTDATFTALISPRLNRLMLRSFANTRRTERLQGGSSIRRAARVTFSNRR